MSSITQAILDGATKLISSYEGCKLTAYNDPVGLLSIGYGSRYINGIPVKAGTTITQAQADSMLEQDVQNLYNKISFVLPNLTENQYIAVLDFAYNTGYYAFIKSTMFNYLKSGNIAEAATQFELWDHAGGKVLPGLLRRRQQEKAIFLGN